MNENLKKSNRTGYVYVLSNPVMPGIVKIGRSIHGGRTRALEIYKQGGTGVPMPFKMEFEVWSEDCITDEEYIHEELENHRINQNREFFSISVDHAIESVLRVICYAHDLTVSGSEVTINDGDLMPSYGYKADDYISEIFPGIPQAYVLTAAIKYYLSHDAVKDAVLKYKEATDKRRAERLAKKEEIELQ